MSKYYKAEDVEHEIRRLLRFRTRNDFDLGIKHGIETVERVLKDLPTIEVSEDCISKQQAIEAIEELDWYHIGFTGELVHGAASDDDAWYKAEDIYKTIESLPSGEGAFRVV